MKKKIFILFFCCILFSGIIIFPKLHRAYIYAMNADISLIKKPSPTIIYDDSGQEIARIGENKYWLDKIPYNLEKAFVSLEDKRFYRHSGIDIIRLSKVIMQNIVKSNNSGASTITQQLVKNIYLSPERTIERKLKEIFLAIRIENNYSKEDILLSYVNNIYYGDGNYGIKMASESFFGKEPSKLTLRESAMLASIVNNPYIYDLRKSMYKNMDMTYINKRTDLCLYLMNKQGYINKKTLNSAYKDSVFISTNKSLKKKEDMYPYPHYTEYAIDETCKILLREQHQEITPKNIRNMREKLKHSGYKVYTSLNTKIQEILEKNALNYDYPKTKNQSPVEVASVIEENSTGYIVAMIGSRITPHNYFTFNRATHAKTPIASILKPIAIYAPAYDMGKDLGDTVLNERVKIDGYDDYALYPPGEIRKNGYVSYQYSLNHSQNIPTARILMDFVGINKASLYLERLDISSKEFLKTGEGFVLGKSLIPIIEVLRGYQAIANDGIYIRQSSIKKILGPSSEVVYIPNAIKKRVYTSLGAKKTKENLRSVVTDGTGYACNIGETKIYGKTGTHQNLIFNFAGFNEKYSSVLWVGTDDNDQFLGNVSSENVASPLFSNIFKDISNNEDTNTEYYTTYNY